MNTSSPRFPFLAWFWLCSATTATVGAALPATPIITYVSGAKAGVANVNWVTLEVRAVGEAPLAYQWKKDGANLPGATNTTFVLGPLTAGSAGTYTVVVSNGQGSATSRACPVNLIPASPPVVRVQPANITVRQDEPLLVAFGLLKIDGAQYQWRKDGAPIPAATNNSYYKDAAAAGDAGLYSCMATNAGGSVVTEEAVVTVLPPAPPTFLRQPAPALIAPGYSAALAVVVSPERLTRLQWYKDGLLVPGATSDRLELLSQSGNAGTYTVLATTRAGSVTSDPAVVSIASDATPPIITTATPSLRTTGGELFVLDVSFTPPVTKVTWAKDGTVFREISVGASDRFATAIIDPFTFGDVGAYVATVHTAAGTVSAAPAHIGLRDEGVPPVIIEAPHAMTTFPNDNVTVSVLAEGEGPLQYRWLKDGVELMNRTDRLYLRRVGAAEAGSYSVVVTNRIGQATTGPVRFVVRNSDTPPVITAHPAPQTIIRGATFLDLSVSTRDDAFDLLTYQWMKNGTPVAGATAKSYTVSAVTDDTAGTYSVAVSNAAGQVTSNEAAVSVYGTGSPFAGVYRGNTLQGSSGYSLCSAYVDSAGKGTLLALLSGLVVGRFEVQPDGSFSFGSDGASRAAGGLDAQFDPGGIAGQFAENEMTARWTAPGKGSWSMRAARVTGQSSPAALVGAFHADVGNGGPGVFDLIVAPDGTGIAFFTDLQRTDAITVQVMSDGRFAHAGWIGTVNRVTRSMTGDYPRWWTTPATSAPFASRFENSGKLINVSTRGHTGAGAQVLTAGFVIAGSGTRKVLVRGIGPALEAFNIAGFVRNPRVVVLSDGKTIVANDDWSVSEAAADVAATSDLVRAFPLTSGAADAALVANLAPGLYTAQVQGGEVNAGAAMVEVYDAEAAAGAGMKLLNLSSRAYVDNNTPLIAGFVIDGNAPKKILVRAVGPGLGPFNVTDFLADPKLEITRGTTVLRANDNWTETFDADRVSTATDAVGAFPLSAGSKDAAAVTVLTPGSYTAVVSGETAGVALVEVYEVP